jgi:hypothetical protein
MRKFTENNQGNVGTIILAVATAVTLAVSILIVYSIIAGIDTTTIDASLDGTPAANATDSLVSGVGTFFSISPIYLIVLVAVAIIGAVMGIMVIRRG